MALFWNITPLYKLFFLHYNESRIHSYVLEGVSSMDDKIKIEKKHPICNKCGEFINKNKLGYLDDFLSVEKTWGYGSNYDTLTHRFNLCMTCYEELLHSFTASISQEEKIEIL